jgi:hypothetical protein
MKAARSPLLRIIAGSIFFCGLTTPGFTGDFPIRPAGVPVQYFTGVLIDYGVGNGVGSFTLKIGKKTMVLGVGGALINHKNPHCIDPTPKGRSGLCDDWPAEIVLGKSVVTARCWSEARPWGRKLFCDEVDSARRRSKR